ncbi:putative pyruvate kinase [Helianthus anomalus]
MNRILIIDRIIGVGKRVGATDVANAVLDVYKCNMAQKPAVVTRVVDSMTDNLRPTCAEATDVANVVLDGKYLIL